jgi:hypothetical protein
MWHGHLLLSFNFIYFQTNFHKASMFLFDIHFSPHKLSCADQKVQYQYRFDFLEIPDGVS